MWISKKKWQALEKRMADLEVRVQSQPKQDIVTDYAKDAIVKYKVNEIKKVFDYIAYPEKHVSKEEVLTILQFHQLRTED